LFKTLIFWQNTFIHFDIHVLLLASLFIANFSGNTLLN
jgi:hypothetical protein